MKQSSRCRDVSEEMSATLAFAKQVQETVHPHVWVQSVRGGFKHYFSRVLFKWFPPQRQIYVTDDSEVK